MTQIYKKIGKRYKKIGPNDGWTGFPTDGIWLVEITPGIKSSRCILKLGDLPKLYPYANLAIQEEDIANILGKSSGKTNLEVAKEITIYLLKLTDKK